MCLTFRSHLNIWCLFLMPQNGSSWGQRLCQLSGTRKCCSAASRRCCYSAIRNSESSSFGCYSFCPLPARPGVSLQLLQVRHTSLCVLIWEEIFIHLSSCPSAVEAQLSLMQTERRGAGHFLPHLRAGKVWKSEGSCAFGAISLFFFFWVQEKHVAGWSSQA